MEAQKGMVHFFIKQQRTHFVRITIRLAFACRFTCSKLELRKYMPKFATLQLNHAIVS